MLKTPREEYLAARFNICEVHFIQIVYAIEANNFKVLLMLDVCVASCRFSSQ